MSGRPASLTSRVGSTLFWLFLALSSVPLFAGALLLSASLAVGFWLPRRRVTLRPVATGLALTLRGERFDDPSGELPRLREAIETR